MMQNKGPRARRVVVNEGLQRLMQKMRAMMARKRLGPLRVMVRMEWAEGLFVWIVFADKGWWSWMALDF